MVDEPIHDDTSYYEISITAGQAFLAVVLLIGSLAAAFAFGIVVGQARSGEREADGARSPVIVEREPEDRGTIMELGVDDDSFASQQETESEGDPEVIEEPPVDAPPEQERPVEPESTEPAPSTDSDQAPVPHVAQILSTTDRGPAEELAATLIEAGFSNAYVERVPSDAGMLYRVRIRFSSEAEAREAVASLRQYSPGEIWISATE